MNLSVDLCFEEVKALGFWKNGYWKVITTSLTFQDLFDHSNQFSFLNADKEIKKVIEKEKNRECDVLQ